MGHGQGPSRHSGRKPGGKAFDAFTPAAEKFQVKPLKSGRPAEEFEGDHLEEDTREGILRSSSEETRMIKDKRRGVLKDLVTKAVKKGPGPKVKKEKKKSSKTAMALVQTLAKGLGMKVKDQRRSKASKKKVRFHNDPAEEESQDEATGGSPSGSSSKV